MYSCLYSVVFLFGNRYWQFKIKDTFVDFEKVLIKVFISTLNI